jgi:hypothetical protein
MSPLIPNARGNPSHGAGAKGKNDNILSAMKILMNELDESGLEALRTEVERRLAGVKY